MKILTATILSLVIAAVPATKEKQALKADNWESIGEQRITCYCPDCNDGEGYESSSGKTLRYGYAACSWLPIGTKISIEGELFEIVDICGTDAIDVFVDTDRCRCNLNEYKKVSIYKGKKNEQN